MKRKIKILYVSAEISPYASAGGLGEVGKSFPTALLNYEDMEVRRVMPLYKRIDRKLKYLTDFSVPMDNEYDTCVLKTDPECKDIITYFIGNDRYFYRDNIYAYEDDGLRFYFFCRAIIEMLKNIKYKPDIVHTNDWHTGFLPLLLKKEFPSIKTVYTIHNISYHGFIPPSYLEKYVSEEEAGRLGYPQWLNFMKAGIIYSDLLTTVSPGYKGEIVQPEYSYGMSELIAGRAGPMVGILNGIDTESYNPKLDGVLTYPYDMKSLEQKKKNRTLLRLEYGLPDTEIPLIAMVTRLDYTKGIDILIKSISHSDLNTFQLIILGSGNPYYQGILESIAEGYSGIMVFESNYSATLAKKIYAAADIYLMPSLFEPCGLGQLYAMRYGAVPIVNPVGGLKDTVLDIKKYPERACGFYMENWTVEALTIAIKQAVNAYHFADWNKLIVNGMKYNASWNTSVAKYRKYYEKLIMNLMK
ncbi:MAG: glycogen/starch synthase [Herbinix sp.]|nr:glycogen/starch synthase [Herbinix sp.]